VTHGESPFAVLISPVARSITSQTNKKVNSIYKTGNGGV